MKVTKSQLKELIKHAIVEDIMDKEIKNPKTGNMIKIKTALQLPDEHPANKKAKDMVAKSGVGKDSGEKQEPEKETKPTKKIKSDPFDDKEKSSDEPKERPKSMRSLDWDSELEPYEIEGWVQDKKFSIPKRIQGNLNDLVDKYGDAYGEAEATGDYDKASEIQKQIDQLLTKSMTRESIGETKKMAKLKDILEEAFEDRPQIDKYKVVEGVKNFGIVGKQLYNNNNIVEIAKQLSEIAESAHHHILGEQDDWFDKVSINKNMKSLKGSVVEFQKTAKEAQALNQRLTALYEDMGHVLNRYYDIDEAHVYGHDDEDSELEEKELDKVDPSKVEPEDDFKDREDKDIDNDGDVDDSDKFLHKKRQAITKAIKKESSFGGVVGIPALGDMIRKK